MVEDKIRYRDCVNNWLLSLKPSLPPVSLLTIVKSCPKTHLRPPGMPKVVNLFVISPDTHSERRIDPHQTIEQLKVSSITSNGILEINKAHEICSMIREN